MKKIVTRWSPWGSWQSSWWAHPEKIWNNMTKNVAFPIFLAFGQRTSCPPPPQWRISRLLPRPWWGSAASSWGSFGWAPTCHRTRGGTWRKCCMQKSFQYFYKNFFLKSKFLFYRKMPNLVAIVRSVNWTPFTFSFQSRGRPCHGRVSWTCVEFFSLPRMQLGALKYCNVQCAVHASWIPGVVPLHYRKEDEGDGEVLVVHLADILNCKSSSSLPFLFIVRVIPGCRTLSWPRSSPAGERSCCSHLGRARRTPGKEN